MDQRTRVLVVGGAVLLLVVALGVQAVAIDRGTVVEQDAEAGEPYPGNTLVGVHSWDNDGRLVEITPDGEIAWEYAIDDSRFFGIDPLREGEAAPGIEPQEDGNVVLFALGEVIPAENCDEEHLSYEATFSHGLDPHEHCVKNRVILMDRSNEEIVWEYNWHDEMIHWHEVHDAVVTEDGEVAIIDMGKNRVFTVNEAGEITWEWYAADHIDQGTEFFEEHVEASPHVDDPDDYAKSSEVDDWIHWNDIVETEEGNFHLSVRNYDMLIEVDPETDEIVDTIGQPGNHSVMQHQHNPQHLEEHGTVLIADSENNRAVEIDADTEEVVWEYTGPEGDPLQWPRDADRLPNGNTIITDSRNNRILEVSPSGEVVWQFEDPDGAVIPLPYVADRLPVGETAGGPPGYELDERTAADHGVTEQVREAETLARWVLPGWMHLPQLLNLLAIVLGSAWLLGEGALYGWRRYRAR
ncbi:Arylsulfotransferase family protein [Halalkaliarchaeum sp. AArc-CO]|uniref:arylsulfotransferase family protein n=1 Tax=Halalkaliarchaeum sp. AArc-CO TaxID=2866381 RepID=UPI00217E4B11|nr:arylsulfotransferase family protein [Halalkaliarchaeum sp. AArc-CO]UWG49805.1 Arylsulfotransferase family protein [Halalkaliarchaeum sp. AArc-CO]